MKVSERTIAAMSDILTGNPINTLDGQKAIAPYSSGPDLVKFFNEQGSNDTYGAGFPSRKSYAEGKIRDVNDSEQMVKVIEGVVSPLRFIGSSFPVEPAVDHLNKYLRLEGFQLKKVSEFYRIVDAKGTAVEIEKPMSSSRGLSHEYIEAQIGKCDSKIASEDFDGAITNARTLLEAVLLDIMEKKAGENPSSYDGDLVKLYKKAQAALNLDPSRKDISDTLRQILVGLTSIVSGMAGLRNKMGDAHAVSYRPSRHHAKLAVNASKTVVDFIFETIEHQERIQGK